MCLGLGSRPLKATSTTNQTRPEDAGGTRRVADAGSVVAPAPTFRGAAFATSPLIGLCSLFSTSASF